MQKIVKNTKFVFELNTLEKKHTDALILWTSSKLNSGDTFFLKVHREAGSLLYDECLEMLMKYGKIDQNNDQIIPPGQTILTRGGNLNQYNVLHCVLPNYRIKKEKDNKTTYLQTCIRTTMELIKAYGESEIQLNTLIIPPLSSNLYGEITSQDLNIFFKTLIELSTVKKIYFTFEDEEQLKEYFQIFNKLTTPFFVRIINKFFKFDF